VAVAVAGWGFVLLAGQLGACVPVSGGALELGWVIRSLAGETLSCRDAGISTVRLVLRQVQSGADPCADKPRCSFVCSQHWGTTEFDIPEGEYTAAIEPQSTTGGRVAGVLTPPPVASRVEIGMATNLGAILLEVPVTPHPLAAAWPPALPATSGRPLRTTR
jgi:hypothetical protein